MTGYTVHTGSTAKFSSGWDNIFRGASKKKEVVVAQSADVEIAEKTKKKTIAKSVKKSVTKITKAKVSGDAKTVTAKPVKRGK